MTTVIRTFEVGERIKVGDLTGYFPNGLLRAHREGMHVVGVTEENLHPGDMAVEFLRDGCVTRVRRGIPHEYIHLDVHNVCGNVKDRGEGACWQPGWAHVKQEIPTEKTSKPSSLLAELEQRLEQARAETEDKRKTYEASAQKVRELKAAVKAIKELS